MINDHHDMVQFTLPNAVGGCEWVLLVDTNRENCDENGRFATDVAYDVTARSLLLFALDAEAGTVQAK